MSAFAGRNSSLERLDLWRDHEVVHGFTDGRWSLIDGLKRLGEAIQPTDLTLATWTASKSNAEPLKAMLRAGTVRSLRLLIDRSFLSRKPDVVAFVRQQFGDEAIRVWSSHAKFAVFHGGDTELLFLTSANLNQNRRIENWSLFRCPDMIAEYLRLVEDMWALQSPQAAFQDSLLARKHTAAVLGGEEVVPEEPAPSELQLRVERRLHAR